MEKKLKTIEIPRKKLTDKQKADKLAFYYANREKCLLRMKAYNLKHKEKLSEKFKDRYKENKQKILSRNKKWRELNKEKNTESKKKEYLKNAEDNLKKNGRTESYRNT